MSGVSVTVVENNPVITVTDNSVNVALTENVVSVIDAPYKKYGAFQYLQNQPIAVANSAYAMKFDTTDYSADVYVSNESRIYFPTAGTYNIQWSGQFENVSNASQNIYVWLRINGTDIVGSTGYVSIAQRKSASPGDESHALVGWNYYLSFTAGQYLELMWSSSSTDVSLESYPVGINPARPSTAALILTAHQIA